MQPYPRGFPLFAVNWNLESKTALCGFVAFPYRSVNVAILNRQKSKVFWFLLCYPERHYKIDRLNILFLIQILTVNNNSRPIVLHATGLLLRSVRCFKLTWVKLFCLEIISVYVFSFVLSFHFRNSSLKVEIGQLGFLLVETQNIQRSKAMLWLTKVCLV